jgi:hypothetical protein
VEDGSFVGHPPRAHHVRGEGVPRADPARLVDRRPRWRGRPTEGLDPAPLGTRGLIVAQLGLVLFGHLVGVAVVAQHVRRRASEPVVVGLALVASASVIAIA